MNYIDVNSTSCRVYSGNYYIPIVSGVSSCLITPPQNDLFVWMDSAFSLSYPGTGTTWNDLSPTGKVGTLVNGVLYKPDNCGVFECDAIDDYIIMDVNRTEFLNTSEWCLNMWFKPRISMAARGLMQFGGAVATCCPTLLLKSLNATTYRVYFQGGYRINIPYVIDDWQNFTMVRTGGMRKTYKNGILLDNRVYGDNSYGGQNFWLNAGHGGRAGCDFGVVNMWKRGLTDSEVLDLFNLYKNRFGL